MFNSFLSSVYADIQITPSGKTFNYISPYIYTSIGDGSFMYTQGNPTVVLSPGGSSPFGIMLADKNRNSIILSEEGFKDLDESLNRFARKVIAAKETGTLEILKKSLTVDPTFIQYSNNGDIEITVELDEEGIAQLITPRGVSLKLTPHSFVFNDVDGIDKEMKMSPDNKAAKILIDAIVKEAKSWL